MVAPVATTLHKEVWFDIHDSGLRVRAGLDDKDYATGVRVTDKEFAEVPIRRDDFHGDWNYSIDPR